MHSMERNRDLDLIRLAANFLVVLIHAYAAFQYCVRGTFEFVFWQFTCHSIASASMPALFCISGYLMFRNLTGENWLSKIRSRVKRLLVPFVVWNLSFAVFYLVLSSCVPRLNSRVVAFGLTTVGGFLSKTISFVSAPIDTPLWYLRTVFAFALLSPAFMLCWPKGSRCGARKSLASVPYLLVAVYYIMTWKCVSLRTFSEAYPPYALMSFVLGGHIAVKALNPCEVLSRRCLWPFAIVGTVALGLIFVDRWWDYSPLREVAKIGVLPLLFLCLPLLRRIFRNEKIYRFLQEGSFFLYGGHFLFCSILLHVLAPLLPGQFCGKFTLLVILFSVPGPVLTYGVYAVVSRFFPRFSAPWTGTL